MPENKQPPESLDKVDLSTVQKFVEYVHEYPQDYYRALIFHLRAKERRFDRFRDETVEVIAGEKKGLLHRVRRLEKIVLQLVGGAEAQGAEEPAGAQGEETAAAPPASDGPGYPPVENLPFPTSGPIGAKPKPTVVKDDGAPTPTQVPEGEGQNNSTVVDVKPNSAAAPPPPNNSRVTNISPIPQGKVR